MDGKFDELKQIGVDVAGVKKRFMNKDALVLKFMRKFPADQNFPLLKEAIEKNNVNDAFTAAHTLKGVAGNLGMNCLMDELVPLVERLRDGNLEGTEDSIANMETIYEEICAAINKLEDQENSIIGG